MLSVHSVSTPPRGSPSDQALQKAAAELEATFLAEMLKSSGLAQTSGAFGGGAGEDQFASFLVLEHARAIVKAGGIGLSEAIFEALKEKDDGIQHP